MKAFLRGVSILTAITLIFLVLVRKNGNGESIRASGYHETPEGFWDGINPILALFSEEHNEVKKSLKFCLRTMKNRIKNKHKNIFSNNNHIHTSFEKTQSLDFREIVRVNLLFKSSK